MVKVIGLILVCVALILSTFVGFHVVMAVVPQYLSIWVIATVFTWVGVFLFNMPD
jgi:fucose 4-O-acetylase-like acetyltransferase